MSSGMWWTRRAIGLHATLVVVVPGFLALFWWQVQRVRQGNTLSWAYVFEWPFFTGYAVYLWWKLVHDQPALAEQAVAPRAPDHAGQPAAATTATPAEEKRATVERATVEAAQVPASTGAAAHDDACEDDTALAAYNRYLAELNASDRRKTW